MITTSREGPRLAKHTLGWDKAALRHPEQVARWTWLIIAAITQLRLARPIAADHRQRWERRRSQGKLSPGRVRRDFARLAGWSARRPARQNPPSPAPGGQRAAATPRTTPRHQEGHLTSLNGLKRKRVEGGDWFWVQLPWRDV